jgi:hypothetical protein
MLRLLVDTSVWLDLAKRRDGQRWIVPIRALILSQDLELLVPPVLLEEFTRNRDRIEAAMSTSVAERFRLLRRDIVDYGGADSDEALGWIDSLAHQVPMIGAMATRNFKDILELLQKARSLLPSSAEHTRVVQRGLTKAAPLHRQRNSVADALLIEQYASVIAQADLTSDRYGFVTANCEDFSVPKGDRRQPHPDIADLFTADGSGYHLGVEGLISTLREHLGTEFDELVGESDFTEEPRRLDEILQAEQEFFDRVWYERHLVFRAEYEAGEDDRTTPEVHQVALEAAERARARRPDLRPCESDFEWGMWNGKLSAMRWVLGEEWDFLDT